MHDVPRVLEKPSELYSQAVLLRKIEKKTADDFFFLKLLLPVVILLLWNLDLKYISQII